MQKAESHILTFDQTEPFRAPLLSADRLGEQGVLLAQALSWDAKPSRAQVPLIALIGTAETELSQCNRLLSEAILDQQPVSPAAEWLLDNYYLIQGQIMAVRADLPKEYGRELPRITEGPLVGQPRIWALAVHLLAHTDARLDEDGLAAFVEGFQEVDPLSIGEVWAVPIMLRAALVENVRRLAGKVARAHMAVRRADECADRLLTLSQETVGDLDIENYALGIKENARSLSLFVARLSQRLSGQDIVAETAEAWLRQQLSALGMPLDELSLSLQHEQAADQVSIANTITSIRFVEAKEWRAFFEQTSFVEQALRQDPAGTYPRMDFASRDRYRHALEELAKRSPLSEVIVAEATVALCLEALKEKPGRHVKGHVGNYLIGPGRYALEKAVSYRPRIREWLYRGPLAKKWLFYWGLIGAQTALLTGALIAWMALIETATYVIAILSLLAVIPLSELAMRSTNRIATWVFPPRVLPKLNYLEPITSGHRTLVVVPALLSSIESVRRVLDNLEVAYMANRDDNIGFALLGDLKPAKSKHAPSDEALSDAAIKGVEALNERYLEEHGRAPFSVFIRERRYNATEGSWMGWERKRGSLVDLNRWLKGAPDTSFSHTVADSAFLRSVTFVITLDADTVLPRDCARKLIGTIAHPLNRAEWREGEPLVRAGYGLVQPRVGMTLGSSGRSFFSWLYSGETGIDPYARAVSDTYQDVFGEGSFTGKGIYEVNLFAAVLDGRLPENTLLSHDLIEGTYLRVLLASDVEVLDEYPAAYLAQAARMHRWVRGDWQTLPWLFPKAPTATGAEKNPLTFLHRWKIVDNLRRSLHAPSLLALILLGWLLAPAAAWDWPLVISLIVLFQVYFSFFNSLLSRSKGVSLAGLFDSILRDFARDSSHAALTLILLPHQAQMMLDAILRALWRMFVSRKKLLEWETAADVEHRIKDGLAGYVRRLGPASLVATALLTPSLFYFPDRALPFLILASLWLTSPVIAWRISLRKAEKVDPLSADDHLILRKHARRTWRFFETFVSSEGNYLAPDNFQEDPKGEIAWRTSPTNIGLQLLSTLSAYDLGYITLKELVAQSADTLNSLVGLEKYSGHYYNWYDIKTKQPLPPKYVSTVDSGNLAGHLLVFRIGLLEASEGPVLAPSLLDGLADTISLAIEDLGHAERSGLDEAVRTLSESLMGLSRDISLLEQPQNLGEWHALLYRLKDLLASIPHLESSRLERSPLEAVDTRLQAMCSFIDEMAPWSENLLDPPVSIFDDPRAAALSPLLAHVPSLVGLAEGLQGAMEALDSIAADPFGDSEKDRDLAAAWASKLAQNLRDTRPQYQELLARLRIDAAISRQIWERMDFGLLFDKERLLFAIGYNTAEGRIDQSYYDMLASECRLASYLAVAKSDVPLEHWFRLGRAVTRMPSGQKALLSWSASMFEYLMPLLIMRNWPLTLLGETCSAIVQRQIQYGNERGVPWGVSESAFNAKDSDLVYQYQAFGVPGLGLKRGLSGDLVIAPYATALALPYAPKEALKNLESLAKAGGCGQYGYYEALDFTPGRIPAGAKRAIVKAYFAHHQGMSLVAFANMLTDYRMRERFHSDPIVRSAELLLQERVPRNISTAQPHIEEVEHVRISREPPVPVRRSYPLADTPVPSTHFLSNGRYAVMVTNGGGGYSRWEDLAVTRYREDVTRDCWGQFLYLRDVENGSVWSATHNPCPTKPDEYYVMFSADKAEYRRRDGDIACHLEISVSPEDDIEIRRLTISNEGHEPRSLEVTSYFEVALTAQGADQAHRCFSNLFVETEALENLRTLLFTRRPRSSQESRRFGIHTLACEIAEKCPWSYETDRAAFLGRLHGAANPVAVSAGGDLARTTGAVLDPVCAIRQAIKVEPGMSVRLVFVTGVAESRESAVRLAEKYHDVRSAQRAIDLAWTTATIELRDLGISPQESVTLQRLASRLLLTDPYSALKVKTPTENGLPLSGLWALGISGDYPILLVRVEDPAHTPLVRQALLAHQYWRHKGLIADLVILNTRPTSYADELDSRLRLLVRTGHALQLIDRPGGVFLRRADQMHPDILNLLLSVARATLEGDGGPIEVQLNRRGVRPDYPDQLVPASAAHDDPAPPFTRPSLLFDNGYGGFDPETGEYVIILEGEKNTPAPWVNVMASPRFGCMVSEAGIACTWAENSHENRITTWNNDPVSDGSGEVIYIRDEETGEFWSPTPLPVRNSAPYLIRHATGASRFEHHAHGISSTLEIFVSAEDPVRVARLTLENTTGRNRRLSATQFVEWVLGNSRSKAQHLVVTWYDAEHELVTAHNHYNPDYPGRATFLACDRPLHSYTCSRTEFMGRNRAPSNPAAMHRKSLGGHFGRYHDNCGAIMTMLEVAPGESASVTFLLGQTAVLDEARDLVDRYKKPGAIDNELRKATGRWNTLCSTLTCRTPDAALDLLVSKWLLYQALSCRLWGRTATYQSSGAFGFRDQLQDVLAMMFTRPDLVRAQIIEASRRQFPEGDVLHWWQPATGRGVRTRITDDRHWLPYVVSEYISATGDESVLHERTAYLEGPPLEEGQEDNYFQPALSGQAASVYEHCCAALDSGAKTGPHGLPLMGGGDWNDGMNRVGIHGRGESVWLAWFLSVVLKRFAPLCEMMGEPERAQAYIARADAFVAAADSAAWDGAWYRRAYFDDGTPLGTRHAEECRIDAIAQAWATISGAGDPRRAELALNSVEEKLVRREAGLIALLTPPFDKMEQDPGYIKGYVPGVRENGGQYTHAALWIILAYLLRGDGDEAHGLLELINPVNHALTEEAVAVYKVEPYVVAADVYAAPQHLGRGGWTWYTGSASWFYQVAVRHLLGMWVCSEGDVRYLCVDPCIPKSWKDYSMTFRDGTTTYEILVKNPRGVNRGVARVILDGEELAGTRVPLTSDGKLHEVKVILLGG